MNHEQPDIHTGSRGTRPNVWTIPPGAPFLETLVQACLDGSLGVGFDKSQRDFSHATVYVPTRRAGRALAHAFADALQPRAVLLPRIVPLGEASDLEDKAILSDSGFDGDSGIDPAIGDLHRRLLLTRLVDAWRASAGLRELALGGDGFTLGESPADSFALAGDLARLLDDFAIEGADWSLIDGLADGQFDTYWSLTRDFLAIAGKAWPMELAERRLLDPAERRNQLLRAEAKGLAAHPPGAPVIAAGSTGTVPATAELLRAIARLDHGVVVLPGLDTDIDDRGWELISDQADPEEAQAGHPQAALKRLIGQLGIARQDVRSLGAVTPQLVMRADILGAASRPAEATDAWPAMRLALDARMSDGLKGLSVIDASDEREEALAIAIGLREVLEQGKETTAALITPDRALAERVSVELRRWKIVADDSAGMPLSQLPVGALARLALQAVIDRFAPARALALLHSPCLYWAGDTTTLADARTALELAAMRGRDVGGGLNGLRHALENSAQHLSDHRAHRAVKTLGAAQLSAAAALLDWLGDAVSPFDTAAEQQTLSAHCAHHAACLERLAGERMSSGGDAKALAAVFDEMTAAGTETVLTLEDYAQVFDQLLREKIVPSAEPVQGRIKIWGLLEARLLTADRIILGGLNEGTWPPEARSDAFLNRPMRAAMGLASPERRIGQSAHDFAQAMGAPEVIIARAVTVEGTPKVASRFLRRIDAFLGETQAKALRQRGQPYLDAARSIDVAALVDPAPRPDPRPSADKQPLSLSVTEIATLYRDPYAIYARHVLGLDEMPPVTRAVDARDRGDIVHEAMAEFIASTQNAWPADPLDALLRHGRAAFQRYETVEGVRAFWWPVFEKVAAWFVSWENTRRNAISHSLTERSGRLTLGLADGASFTLRARADRLDQMTDGSLAVIDYKTGTTPGNNEVIVGYQPQLTLQAAIARAGGFDKVAAASVSETTYLNLGSDPKERKIDYKKAEKSIDEVAATHVAGLKRFLDDLRSQRQGFTSRRQLRNQTDAGLYDHLARAKEWTSTGSDD